MMVTVSLVLIAGIEKKSQHYLQLPQNQQHHHRVIFGVVRFVMTKILHLRALVRVAGNINKNCICFKHKKGCLAKENFLSETALYSRYERQQAA
jgi:hypothetical protein